MTEKLIFNAPLKLHVEQRANDDTLRLQGTAAVFDSETEIDGFVERIRRGAFTNVLARGAKFCRLSVDHSASSAGILASTQTGRLKLRETARGLEFEAELVGTSLARDVALLVRSGEITGASFAFTVDEDDWTARSGGTLREIIKVGELYDVTVTATPAYADASVSARSKTSKEASAMLKDIRARVDAVRTNPVSPYAESSPNSYFADLLLISEATKRQDASSHDPIARGRDLGDGNIPAAPGSPLSSTAEEARARIATVYEKRGLSRALGLGGEFVTPAGVPDFIASKFAIAARASAVVASALNPEPLPEPGLHVEIPRLVTGASVAIQSDGGAVVSTDPTTGLASSPIATVAGMVDASRQDIDRSANGGSLDVVIARDLGKAWGAAADAQILNGSGAAGQTRGLLLSPGVTQTYTSATPTVPAFVSQSWQLYAAQVAALGNEPDLLMVAPRRWAWAMAGQDTATLQIKPTLPTGRPTVAPTVPITLGAGAEDAVIAVSSADVPVFASQPVFKALENPLSGNLQVRFQVFSYVACVPNRQPNAVGAMRGSGLTTPVFP